MSEQQPVAGPRGGVAYPVTLGDSLLDGGGGGGSGGEAFTSFKYDWKVGGGDSTKSGRVKRDRDGNKVTVQFQNVVEGERAVRYQVRHREGRQPTQLKQTVQSRSSTPLCQRAAPRTALAHCFFLFLPSFRLLGTLS